MKEPLKDFLARKQHESLIGIIDARILDAKCNEAMRSIDRTLARSKKIAAKTRASMANIDAMLERIRKS